MQFEKHEMMQYGKDNRKFTKIFKAILKFNVHMKQWTSIHNVLAVTAKFVFF